MLLGGGGDRGFLSHAGAVWWQSAAPSPSPSRAGSSTPPPSHNDLTCSDKNSQHGNEGRFQAVEKKEDRGEARGKWKKKKIQLSRDVGCLSGVFASGGFEREKVFLFYFRS